MTDAPLGGWFKGGGDDDSGNNDKDDITQIPEHIKEDKYKDTLEYGAGGYGDRSVVHGVIITQESVKSKVPSRKS